jgi:hypothetical protein
MLWRRLMRARLGRSEGALVEVRRRPLRADHYEALGQHAALAQLEQTPWRAQADFPSLHFTPGCPRPLPLIEIPSSLAFRSIVSTDVLNFVAISDAVAPFIAIAITSRSSFRVNRPFLRFLTIPAISSPSARTRRVQGALLMFARSHRGRPANLRGPAQ